MVEKSKKCENSVFDPHISEVWKFQVLGSNPQSFAPPNPNRKWAWSHLFPVGTGSRSRWPLGVFKISDRWLLPFPSYHGFCFRFPNPSNLGVVFHYSRVELRFAHELLYMDCSSLIHTSHACWHLQKAPQAITRRQSQVYILILTRGAAVAVGRACLLCLCAK